MMCRLPFDLLEFWTKSCIFPHSAEVELLRPPAATQNLVVAQGEGVIGAAGFIGIVDGLAPPQLGIAWPRSHVGMLTMLKILCRSSSMVALK